jgi:type IV secretory pathway VirB2 component (pilin)
MNRDPLAPRSILSRPRSLRVPVNLPSSPAGRQVGASSEAVRGRLREGVVDVFHVRRGLPDRRPPRAASPARAYCAPDGRRAPARAEAAPRGWALRTCLATVFMALALLAPDVAHAAGGGGALPWEGPLTLVAASLTGPVALAISLVALAATGGILVFGGELNEFARRLCVLVLAISFLVAGAGIMTTLFGVGGAVIGTAPLQVTGATAVTLAGLA